jgi:hypothetical protein
MIANLFVPLWNAFKGYAFLADEQAVAKSRMEKSLAASIWRLMD